MRNSVKWRTRRSRRSRRRCALPRRLEHAAESGDAPSPHFPHHHPSPPSDRSTRRCSTSSLSGSTRRSAASAASRSACSTSSASRSSRRTVRAALHQLHQRAAAAEVHRHLPQEESLYVAEGAPFDKVPFSTTPPSSSSQREEAAADVLILLDEEVRTPQGDFVLARSRSATAPTRLRIGVGRQQRLFVPHRHYAGARRDAPQTPGAAPRARTARRTPPHPSTGDVPCDTRGFVEKDADQLSRNLYALLAGAAEGRTRALFPPKSDAEAGKKASTVGKFRGQRRRSDHRRADAAVLHPVHQAEPAEAPGGDGGLAPDEDDHRAAHVRRRVRGRQDPEDGVKDAPRTHSPTAHPTAYTPHLPRQLPVPPRAPRVRRHLPVDRAQGERLGADPGAPAGGAGAVRRRRASIGPPGLLESAHRPHALPVPRRRPSN